MKLLWLTDLHLDQSVPAARKRFFAKLKSSAPVIFQKTSCAILGCWYRVANLRNGKSCEGMVADAGPRSKAWEISIQTARELGISENPRFGGVGDPTVRYELWPGEKSQYGHNLLRSNGSFA